MIPSFDADGLLPLGRYLTTLDEIESTYASNRSSDRRKNIWEDFRTVHSMLSKKIPICSLWIGGSFTSSKYEPDDIDLCYILTETAKSRLSEEAQEKIFFYHLATNKLRSIRGWRVDSHVMEWRPNPTTTHQGFEEFYKMRGFWDELWSRTRKEKGQIYPEDATIRRGYLEVIFNGFAV